MCLGVSEDTQLEKGGGGRWRVREYQRCKDITISNRKRNSELQGNTVTRERMDEIHGLLMVFSACLAHAQLMD